MKSEKIQLTENAKFNNKYIGLFLRDFLYIKYYLKFNTIYK